MAKINLEKIEAGIIEIDGKIKALVAKKKGLESLKSQAQAEEAIELFARIKSAGKLDNVLALVDGQSPNPVVPVLTTFEEISPM